MLQIAFSASMWYWRGPSPFHFVTVPIEDAETLRAVSGLVTYGWGMVPIRARIGHTEWTTSLFPKGGSYIVPIKDAIRKELGLQVDQVLDIELTVNV